MNTRSAPSDLRTEYADRPMGVTCERPRFSWQPGGRQTAYRLRVAGSTERLAESPRWDSGRVDADRCTLVPYGGPELTAGTRYYWQVRVWIEGEPIPWSEPQWWEMAPAAETLSADWVRAPLPDDAFEGGAFGLLRHEFDLDGAVATARLYVAACHQYAVWINGTEVGRGQSFCYPDRQYYRSYDVTDVLRGDARNAIGIQHVYLGWGKGRPRGEPGVFAQLAVEFEDGSSAELTTSGAWKSTDGATSAGPQRSEASREPIEHIDGRQTKPGWTRPGHASGSWDTVEVVGEHPTAPWERLIPQREGIHRSVREPETIRELDDGTVVVDFGRVYAGVPLVEFEEGEAGREITIRGGYQLDESGHVSTTEGVQWTDMRWEYVQRSGEQTVRPFTFLAFRYLEVEGATEDLRDRVSMIERYHEVPDTRAAQFSCSEPTIESIWELARHSALHGAQEGFLDTPTREKGQFVADAFNISRTAMAAFRERTLTQQALREFDRSNDRYWDGTGRINAVYPTGEGQRDIPDYTLQFVEWVWQYYLASGDDRLLAELYPLLVEIGAYVEANLDDATGLVTRLAGGDRDVYRHGIVDWPADMRYGYDMDAAARTTVNVLAVSVFRRLATMGKRLNRPGEEVESYRTRARALTAAINARLTDVEGVYRDGLAADGTLSDHASQHANAMALAFDLVPEDRIERVGDHVAASGMCMGPMTAYWLLEALDRSDNHDTHVDLLSNASEDGWAKILEAGGTFTWESWKARELPDEERYIVSESHAWGATVLVAIQRFLLGVRIEQPGGSEVRIAPPSSGLLRAEGKIPTERGPIECQWERTDTTVEIDLALPHAVDASLDVPPQYSSAITVDGTRVWADGERRAQSDGVDEIRDAADGLQLDLKGGAYHVSAR